MEELARHLNKLSYVHRCEFTPKHAFTGHQITIELKFDPTAEQIASAVTSAQWKPTSMHGYYEPTAGKEPSVFWGGEGTTARQLYVSSMHDISKSEREKIKKFFAALRPTHLGLVK